jgi:hypothetical protein
MGYNTLLIKACPVIYGSINMKSPHLEKVEKL